MKQHERWSLTAMVAAALLVPSRGAGQAVRSWAYQLDRVDVASLAATDFDLLVVDHSRDGTEAGILRPAEVAALHRRPSGAPRLVLSYMSIGEAEDYRFYWRESWRTAPPTWLDEENPEWPGNYKVRYWDPAWRQVIFGTPGAYLDRILEAGFDGVYLDIIDAFEYYEDARPTAADEMVAFVRAIASYARARRPGFLVIPQNGERLLERDDYLETIDGIAKEDLFWGYDGIEAPTPRDERAYSERFLTRARDAGKLVLTVDYAPSERVEAIYRSARAEGFVPYVTVRALDRITVNRGLDPSARPGIGVPGSRRLPGGFFALTAPRGVFRINLSADRWSERLAYSDEDFGAPPGPSRAASEFDERTLALSVGYGVNDHVELGAVVPVVRGHFVRAGDDASPSVPPSRDASALGDVRLFAAASTSWNEDSDHLLGNVEVALPSDGRGAPFTGGNGSVRAAATAEHYWARLGIIGQVGVTTYLGETLGDSESVFEIGAGVGLELPGHVYVSAIALREGDALRPELSTELLLGGRSSLEVFAGHDVGGTADALSLGAALNLWVGG